MLQEDTSAIRRIRCTALAGLFVAIASGLFVLYALGFSYWFAEPRKVTITLDGCKTPDGMTAFPVALAVRGVMTANVEGRLNFGGPRQSYTTIDIKPRPIDDDEDDIRDDWFNACDQIELRTNLGADHVRIFYQSMSAGESTYEYLSFEEVGPETFRLKLPRQEALTPRLEIRHLYPLDSAGPATTFLRFKIRVRLSGHPKIRANLKRFTVALESPGQLVDLSTAGRLSDRWDTAFLPDPPPRTLSRRPDRPLYFYFDEIKGLIRFQRAGGVMAQQAMLMAFSALFGAGISALLEAFLAISVLSAQRAHPAPAVFEQQEEVDKNENYTCRREPWRIHEVYDQAHRGYL